MNCWLSTTIFKNFRTCIASSTLPCQHRRMRSLTGYPVRWVPNKRWREKHRYRQALLAESIRSFWQQIRQSIAVPWMLAAAQAVVIVLLVIPAPEQNTFSTLSATKAAENAEKIGINVVFRPNAPESDIRSLLHTIQGSISNGPSREGHYVVSVGSRNDLDQAVRILKQSVIVLFAEPVVP